jgi:hypothetical protein
MDAEKTEIKTFYTFAFCNSICSVFHCTIARVLIPFVLYNGEFLHHENWAQSGLPRIPLTQLTTQNGDYEAFIPNDSSTAYFGVQFNGQHIDYDALYRGPRVKGKFLEFGKRKEIEAAMVQSASYFPNKTPLETKGFAEKIAGFILERARDGMELSKVLRVIQSQWRRDVRSAPIHLTSKVEIGDGDTFVPNNGYNWDQAHEPEQNPGDFDSECTDTVRVGCRVCTNCDKINVLTLYHQYLSDVIGARYGLENILRDVVGAEFARVEAKEEKRQVKGRK